MNDAVQDRSTAGKVTVYAGRHSDDPIIYFTLIDFLIQLLFFGLFLVVVFQFGGGNEDEDTVEIRIKKTDVPIFDEFRTNRANLPFYKGMSELVSAESQDEMLKALRELKKQDLLDDFLKFATQAENPLEVIKYCAKEPARCKQLVAQCEKQPEACGRFSTADEKGVGRMMGALGWPACREDKKSLFIVDGHGSGYPGEVGGFEVRQIYPAGQEELARAGVKLTEGQELTKGQAQTIFGPLSMRQTKCAHYVDYVVLSDSESLRAILADSFYLRTKVLNDGIVRDRAIPQQ